MTGTVEPMVYRPGEWKCDRCGFFWHKRILSATDGEVYADGRSMSEPCPNECGGLMVAGVLRELVGGGE